MLCLIVVEVPVRGYSANRSSALYFSKELKWLPIDFEATSWQVLLDENNWVMICATTPR